MLELAQVWLGLADKAKRYDQYRLAGYRAKAWACEARARRAPDPQQRVELETSSAPAQGAGAIERIMTMAGQDGTICITREPAGCFTLFS